MTNAELRHRRIEKARTDLVSLLTELSSNGQINLDLLTITAYQLIWARLAERIIDITGLEYMEGYCITANGKKTTKFVQQFYLDGRNSFFIAFAIFSESVKAARELRTSV